MADSTTCEQQQPQQRHDELLTSNEMGDNLCDSDEYTSIHFNNNSSTEELLRSIWDKLCVGKDGYLNIDELYAVCEHIGMEMNEDVIEQLFEKLDCDQDGKVSFDELLQGLFVSPSEINFYNC